MRGEEVAEPTAVAYIKKLRLLRLGFSKTEIKEMSIRERSTWEYISKLESRASKKKHDEFVANSSMRR